MTGHYPAQGPDPIPMELIGQFGQYGFQGLVIAAQFAAIVWLVKRWQKCADDRITDTKALYEALGTFDRVMREQTDLSVRRVQAQEAMARTQEMQVISHSHLTEEIKRLVQMNDNLVREIGALKGRVR